MNSTTLAVSARIDKLRGSVRDYLTETSIPLKALHFKENGILTVYILLITDFDNNELTQAIQRRLMLFRVLEESFEEYRDYFEPRVVGMDEISELSNFFFNQGFSIEFVTDEKPKQISLECLESKGYRQYNPKANFSVDNINVMLQKSLEKKPLEILFANVAKGDLCIVFGREKTGKSIFLTQIAQSLTKGLAVLPGQKAQCENLNVMYLDGEMTDLEWRYRYTSNADQTDLFEFDNDRFKIVFEQEGIKGMSRNKKLQVMLSTMQTYYNRKAFDVLIIDNLGIYLEDETNTTEISTVLQGINYFRKQNNVTVILAHHITKLPSTEPITTDSMRGSGRISDYASSFIALNKTLSDDGYVKLLRSRNSSGSGENVYPYSIVKEKNFTHLSFSPTTAPEMSLLKAGAAMVYTQEDIELELKKAKKRIDIGESASAIHKELSDRGYPVGSLNTFKARIAQY